MMRLTPLVIFLGLTTSIAAADEVKIVGTIDQSLPATASTNLKAGSKNTGEKHIKLLKLELSKNKKNDIANKLTETANPSLFASASYLPKKVQLGMNDVPVLDQGHYGTCATFAVTAAIDAVIGKGDYISQLCSLELGNYLEKNATISSGWDGSMAPYILTELSLFGVVDKEKQAIYGCGGLNQYPTQEEPIPETDMSPVDYHQLSTSLQQKMGWSPIINEFTLKEKQTVASVIKNIKTILNAKDRLPVGALLADVNFGTAGALGQYHAVNDTWVLTPEIIKDLTDFINGDNPDFKYGGHEMVLTGYDDSAVAKDSYGRTYKGLFTLRNSWGKERGDKGDFYMSYNYFATLVLEAHRIRSK